MRTIGCCRATALHQRVLEVVVGLVRVECCDVFFTRCGSKELVKKDRTWAPRGLDCKCVGGKSSYKSLVAEK